MVDKGGNWIADQLALHRIPQKDFAAAIGVDPSAVTRLLRGARRLKESEVPIAHAFFAAYGQPRRMPPVNLVRAMSMRGVSLADLSKRSGVGESRLLEIKLGQGETPNEDEQERIAEAFGQEPTVLFGDSAGSGPSRDALNEGWRTAGPTRAANSPVPSSNGRIPVYRALPPLGGGRYAAHFSIAERLEPPPALRGVPRAFGVFVADRSSAPFVLPGDVYFVNPGRPVLDGDRCLVRLGDDAVAIGVVREGPNSRMLDGPHLHRPIDLAGKGIVLEGIVGIWGR